MKNDPLYMGASFSKIPHFISDALSLKMGPAKRRASGTPGGSLAGSLCSPRHALRETPGLVNVLPWTFRPPGYSMRAPPSKIIDIRGL